MSEPAARFLVTNFREVISILEGLRVSPRPARGLGHIDRRPVVAAPLRAAEATIIAGAVSAEFPVLIEVDQQALPADETFQSRAIPVGRIRRFVFRTASERGRLETRLFENVGTEGVMLDVDPALFDGEGEARFAGAEDSSRDPETANWRAADSVAGAVAALLALRDDDPGAGDAAAAFVHGGNIPLTLAHLKDAAVETPRQGLGALFSLMMGHRGRQGQDPGEVLRDVIAVLGTSGVPKGELEKFRRYVTGVLDASRSRAPGSLSDDRNILLRALLLIIQRSSVEDVLLDRVAGERPGPKVLTTAAVLAGLREGLAHMPAGLKHRHRDIIGPLACVIEDNGVTGIAAVADTLKQLIAEPAPDIVVASPSIDALQQAGFAIAGLDGTRVSLHHTSGIAAQLEGDERRALLVEVAPWKRSAQVKAALRAHADLPDTWRLVLGDDDVLRLMLPFPDGQTSEILSARASEAVAATMTLTGRNSAAKGRKRTAARRSAANTGKGVQSQLPLAGPEPETPARPAAALHDPETPA